MGRWLVGLLLLSIVEFSTLHASGYEEEVQEFQGVTRQVENLTLTLEPLPTMRPYLLPNDALYQPKALIERIQQSGGLTPQLIKEFYETYKGYRDCGSLWWDAFLSYKQEDDLKTHFFCPQWMPEAMAVHMVNITTQWFHLPQSLEEHQRWHPYAACLFMAVIYNHPQALTFWEHLRVLPTQQAQVLQDPQFIYNHATRISEKERTNLNNLGRVTEVVRMSVEALSQQARTLKNFPKNFTQLALSAQNTALEAYENHLHCLYYFVGKHFENQAAYMVKHYRDIRWMVYTPLLFPERSDLIKDNDLNLKIWLDPQRAMTLATKEGEIVKSLDALRKNVGKVFTHNQEAVTGLSPSEFYKQLMDGFNFNYYSLYCTAWQRFSIKSADKGKLREVYQARFEVEQSFFDLLNQASEFKALKIHEMLNLHNNLWGLSTKVAQNQEADQDKLLWIGTTLQYIKQALTFVRQTSCSLQEEYRAQRRHLDQLRKNIEELKDKLATAQRDDKEQENLQAELELKSTMLKQQQEVFQGTHKLFEITQANIVPLKNGIEVLKKKRTEIVSGRHFRQSLSPLKELPRH